MNTAQTEKDRKAGRDLVMILLVGSLVIGTIALVSIPPPRQQQIDLFSLEVRDVLLDGTELDPSKFSCQVYATNSTNFWPYYILIQNDTADRIEDPIEANCDYMVSFSGKIGNVTYPERWQRFWPGHMNALYAVARPAFANLTVMNASTSEPVDPKGITTQGLIIEINTDPSNPRAGYIAYYDPRVDDIVMPWIQVNFNASVGLADHNMMDGSCRVLPKYRCNSTCLGFGLTYMTCSPARVTTLFQNATTAITSIHLLWGNEVLC